MKTLYISLKAANLIKIAYGKERCVLKFDLKEKARKQYYVEKRYQSYRVICSCTSVSYTHLTLPTNSLV